MKTNVNLEFINKVKELNEKVQDLAIFWLDNEKELEELNVSKDYPFNTSFYDLAFNVYNWLLTLINNYCKKDLNNFIDFFDAYYKSLQK